MLEVFTDGASTGSPGFAGAGVFINNNGKVERNAFPLGIRDVHEAEFLAVIHALTILKRDKAAAIALRSDSQTVVHAIEKEFIRNSKYKPLLAELLELSAQFPLLFIKWIPTKQNRADELARQGIRLNEGINDK